MPAVALVPEEKRNQPNVAIRLPPKGTKGVPGVHYPVNYTTIPLDGSPPQSGALQKLCFDVGLYERDFANYATIVSPDDIRAAGGVYRTHIETRGGVWVPLVMRSQPEVDAAFREHEPTLQQLVLDCAAGDSQTSRPDTMGGMRGAALRVNRFSGELGLYAALRKQAEPIRQRCMNALAGPVHRLFTRVFGDEYSGPLEGLLHYPKLAGGKLSAFWMVTFGGFGGECHNDEDDAVIRYLGHSQSCAVFFPVKNVAAQSDVYFYFPDNNFAIGPLNGKFPLWLTWCGREVRHRARHTRPPQ